MMIDDRQGQQWFAKFLVRSWVAILCCFLAGAVVGAATYPLKVSSTNPRLLVDQNNAPFFLVGDSPHALIVNLTVADATRFFEDRRTNGFNSLWIEVLAEDSEAGRVDGSLLDGTKPFTNTLAGGFYDFTTPNEAYFAHVDTIVRVAATNGLLLLLNPLDTGGWTDSALANGTNRCRQYGLYLGNRYKSFTNILWLSGNDFQTWRTAADDAAVSAVARGIKEADTNHLQTVQLDYPVSGSLDSTNWARIVNVDSAYSYYAPYERVHREYQRTNHMPVVYIEGHYESQTNYYGDFGTPLVLRRQTYWSLLSGAVGYCYGNSRVWRFIPGWDNATNLYSVGVQELKHATALFSSRRWQAFAPDLNRTVLIAGFGTYATNVAVGSNNFATCARETNGHTVMIYVPTQRAMTVDLTKISGTNASAWWFNPRAGTATNLGVYLTTGSQVFTPPDTNDWVLVLDDAARNYPAPGSAPLTAPLQVAANPLPTAQIGVVYSASLAASGGMAPYQWTLAPGSPPPPDGLSLSLDGILSGTTAATGVFNFAVMLTDADGVFAKGDVTLSVTPQQAGTGSFTNLAVITIPDLGPATPYPAPVAVAGLGGVVGHVAVNLNGLNHTWPGDLEMLLVSPTGRKAVVMSDAGKSYTAGSVTLTLSDIAAAQLPETEPITSGVFKPTDYPPDDGFPDPAPAAPHATNLATFLGDSPNGVWSLYVFDDASGNSGAIVAGWSLAVSTVIAPELSITATETNDVVLRWAAPASRFLVQVSADLSQAGWADVAVTPALDGSRYQVILPQTNGLAFYRLSPVAPPTAGEPTMPPLEVAPHEPNQIALRWPVSPTTFVLEQNTNLATANWVAVTAGRGVWLDGTNQINLPASDAASHFRLRLP